MSACYILLKPLISFGSGKNTTCKTNGKNALIRLSPLYAAQNVVVKILIHQELKWCTFFFARDYTAFPAE
jgi:hypothetical protein